MTGTKFKNFEIFEKRMLSNKKVKKAFDELDLEYSLIAMIIRKRVKEGLTQKQLANKMGVKQPLISRLESGKYNPSVNFLRRVAKGLNANLKITITQNTK